MAVTPIAFRGAFKPSNTSGYVVESQYVKGTYIVVDTLAARDGLLAKTGMFREHDVIVEGSLVYVAENSTLYMYKDHDWKLFTSILEAEFQSNLEEELSKKQDTLTGDEFKTVNGQSIFGRGDVKIGAVQFDTLTELLATDGEEHNISFVKENNSTYRWDIVAHGWKCVGRGDLTEYYTKQEIEQYVNNKVDELSSSITSLDNTLQAVDSKVDALEESKQDILTNESTLGTINGIDFKYGQSIEISTVDTSIVVDALATPMGQEAIADALVREPGQSAIVEALSTADVSLDAGEEISN